MTFKEAMDDYMKDVKPSIKEEVTQAFVAGLLLLKGLCSKLLAYQTLRWPRL